MGLWFGIVVCVNLSLVLALLPCIVLGRPAGFDNKADSESCDYINGEWVYDASLPLYNSSSCPFITTAFDCQKNGRPDKDYLKYQWKPSNCVLPKWNYFEVEGKLQKDMDRLKALGTAWTTWANWVDTNVDPSKTKVFYQGVATTHQDAREWKDPTATDCRGQTEPIKGSKYPGMSIQGEAVIKSIISKMTKPVYFLDITLLTQLRKDGHPSVYAGGGDDCSHWCVPGAPDAWNQILYAASLGK
ncbi:hypothetical protein HS088_TW21G00214 [Tripterygium wilfordii]|uniref:Trichome birefringence-like C-terminal domain-containing protein n=1 Tax=Tripterygium wilfordii TaxID=458696 RepID=A0A7J7C1U5_TRIWF|nr:hypothetical protein HS088_TW21G00214 [Tripterygium wilfordii]